MNAGSLSFSTWVAVLLIGAGLAEAFFPLINLYHLVERAQNGHWLQLRTKIGFP